MKKILIIILGLFGVAYGQTIGYLRYDSVKMAKNGGTTELILENATKAVTGGVLTNMGNGRTAFVAGGGVIVSDSAWSLTGNASTVAGTNFVGTTDAVGLMFKVNNVQAGYIDVDNGNTSLGENSAISITNGGSNVAIGYNALNANITGSGNTAVGASALGSVLGSYNTAIGEGALANVTGINNIAIGRYSAQYFTNDSNHLIINSLNRTNKQGDTTKSIIYGAQDATAANQRLYLNSQVYLPYAASGVGTKALRINPGTGLVTYADTTAGGSGISGLTTNYITKATSATTIGNSLLTDNATTVGLISPATTTTGLDVSSSTITSGALATFTNTGTAAAGNTKTVGKFYTSGANATSTQTTYGVDISNTNTGTSSTNVALRAVASGATTNTAISATGSINGTSAQTSVSGSGYSNLFTVNHTVNTSASYDGTGFVSNIATSGANSSTISAFKATTNLTASSNMPSEVDGFNNIFNHLGGGGTLTNVKSFRTAPAIIGAGTVTNLYHYYATNVFANGGGVCTNQYGMAIDAMTTGTNNVGLLIGEATGTKSVDLLIGTTTIPTGNWGIYNASTQNNYFAGSVGIGTTSPTAAKLQVTGNGAASVSGGLWDGTWFTGGTSTTTKPQLLIEPTGTTSTAWSTSGTGLGINAASGFTGNLIDAQVNGASKFAANKDGSVISAGYISGSYLRNGNNNFHIYGANTATGSIGAMTLYDGSETGAAFLQMGGTSSSYPGLSRNGTGIDIKLANNSAYTNISALTTRTTAVAFASLPTGVTGMIATVNNSTTNTWGATIAGGGANTVLAFFNGTNWTVIGQ